MIGLFGQEVAAPVYKNPLTARERAANLAEKLAAKIAKKTPDPFNVNDFDLSSFPQSPVKAAFVGQNVYVKPGYVVSMPEFCFFNQDTGEIVDRNPRTMTADFLANQENLLNNDSAGKLSKKAITGLRNSINWLCLSAKKKRVFVRDQNKNFFFKINFITLTLPDTQGIITSADLQKQLLNPFLTYLRKYHSLLNYVWRLEFQANGKLHVHLTCDTFLHHRVIRDAWNRLLDQRGHLDLFFKKNGHKDPNSTDVHATRKIKNMAAYLAKYMSKKNSIYTLAKKPTKRKLGAHSVKAWYRQRVNFWNSPFNPRPITGRIWGCSMALSKANKAQVHVPAPECAEQLKCFMNNTIMYKEIFSVPKDKKESLYSASQPELSPRKIGEVFFLTAHDWLTKVTGVVRRVFEDTRLSIASVSQCLTFELV